MSWLRLNAAPVEARRRAPLPLDPPPWPHPLDHTLLTTLFSPHHRPSSCCHTFVLWGNTAGSGCCIILTALCMCGCMHIGPTFDSAIDTPNNLRLEGLLDALELEIRTPGANFAAHMGQLDRAKDALQLCLAGETCVFIRARAHVHLCNACFAVTSTSTPASGGANVTAHPGNESDAAVVSEEVWKSRAIRNLHPVVIHRWNLWVITSARSGVDLYCQHFSKCSLYSIEAASGLTFYNSIFDILPRRWLLMCSSHDLVVCTVSSRRNVFDFILLMIVEA